MGRRDLRGWETFGEALREARDEKGWSQHELARESGVARGAISQIETGRREGRHSKIKKLAAALSVSFVVSGSGWLVHWPGSRYG